MKSKISLAVFVLLFTIGTVAFADFVGDSGLGSNTGSVLKTGPSGTHTTYEKVGTWEGTYNLADQKAGLAGGSYAGDSTHKKGVFAEKIYIPGATKIIKDKTSTGGDLVTKVVNTANGDPFDQWLNTATFIYPIGSSNKYAKGVEAVLFGRMLGKIAITDEADNITNPSYNPTYDLELQAKANNAFKPTTNIGLGDKCSLYAYDIGTSVNDGGGCPVGSYVSFYKTPSVSGTPTASNNVNGVVIATCTQFNPSASPSTSACNPGNAFVTTNKATEYRCTDTTSPDYNTKQFGLFGLWCNGSGSVSPTGQCKFTITTKASSAKIPQVRYTRVSPNTPTTYTNISGTTYTTTNNCTGYYDNFEIIDSYGQYYKWSV